MSIQILRFFLEGKRSSDVEVIAWEKSIRICDVWNSLLLWQAQNLDKIDGVSTSEYVVDSSFLNVIPYFVGCVCWPLLRFLIAIRAAEPLSFFCLHHLPDRFSVRMRVKVTANNKRHTLTYSHFLFRAQFACPYSLKFICLREQLVYLEDTNLLVLLCLQMRCCDHEKGLGDRVGLRKHCSFE